MAGADGTWSNETTIKKRKGEMARAGGETKRTARVRGRAGQQQVSLFFNLKRTVLWDQYIFVPLMESN
jgi:hypothetical protein